MTLAETLLKIKPVTKEYDERWRQVLASLTDDDVCFVLAVLRRVAIDITSHCFCQARFLLRRKIPDLSISLEDAILDRLSIKLRESKRFNKEHLALLKREITDVEDLYCIHYHLETGPRVAA